MAGEVIKQLNSKKLELKGRLKNLYQGGSQRRETLEYKIKKIEELTAAYQSTSFSPVNLAEAKEILEQQVGFEEQKRRILESLEAEEFIRNRKVKKNPLVLCLSGSPGVGKTTFASLLAQSLKREFFSIALGGLSDASALLGTSENASGTEIGQLARALVETKKCNPLILLDEIDKAGSSFKTAIHDCLINVLDSIQNHEVLDYYLDVKLDFSQAIFVITANDLGKIPDTLRSRMLIVELPGYDIEQKKAIAQKIIKNWFDQNEQLDQNNLEIDSEALENLINKTNEKGVRQLKLALDIIFEHCLLQWAREARQGITENKIIVTSDLVNQIIPQPFPNIDNEVKQEQYKENNDNREQLKNLRNDLKTLQWEKDKLTNLLSNNNQNKLKASKFHALIVIKKALNNVELEENKTILDDRDYEKEINNANSPEEVEAVREEVLLRIMERFPRGETNEKTKLNYSGNWLPIRQNDHKGLEKLTQEISKMNDNHAKIKELEEQLTQVKEQSIVLEKQLDKSQQNSAQLENMQKEIQILKEPKKINWNLPIIFVLGLIAGGICVMLGFKNLYMKR